MFHGVAPRLFQQFPVFLHVTHFGSIPIAFSLLSNMECWMCPVCAFVNGPGTTIVPVGDPMIEERLQTQTALPATACAETLCPGEIAGRNDQIGGVFSIVAVDGVFRRSYGGDNTSDVHGILAPDFNRPTGTYQTDQKLQRPG